MDATRLEIDIACHPPAETYESVTSWRLPPTTRESEWSGVGLYQVSATLEYRLNSGRRNKNLEVRTEQSDDKEEDLGRQLIGMDRAERGTVSSPAKPTSSIRGEADMSAMERMKKGFLSFTTSMQEGLAYFKASLLGQVRKMSAKDEKEASEADLQTAKMQVEAADAAEDTKKRLGM